MVLNVASPDSHRIECVRHTIGKRAQLRVCERLASGRSERGSIGITALYQLRDGVCVIHRALSPRSV